MKEIGCGAVHGDVEVHHEDDVSAVGSAGGSDLRSGRSGFKSRVLASCYIDRDSLALWESLGSKLGGAYMLEAQAAQAE